jgi:hypothetical protein
VIFCFFGSQEKRPVISLRLLSQFKIQHERGIFTHPMMWVAEGKGGQTECRPLNHLAGEKKAGKSQPLEI